MALPMKRDRELIQLARANLSVEQISTRMKLAPATVIKTAKRLGLRVSPITFKRNGRLKAKR
jgi:hypothetical protein